MSASAKYAYDLTFLGSDKKLHHLPLADLWAELKAYAKDDQRYRDHLHRELLIMTRASGTTWYEDCGVRIDRVPLIPDYWHGAFI